MECQSETASSDLERVACSIVSSHIGDITAIERLRTGICNEVFAVTSEGADYIVRMNKDVAEMRGSSLFIPKLAALGITVPHIIVAEYDTSKIGFGYQILERLPGTDLGNVIETLKEKELVAVAGAVADIFRKLRTLPTDGTYGSVNDDRGGKLTNWKEWVDEGLQTAAVRAKETGFADQIAHLAEPMHSVIRRYDAYFKTAPSVTYYDDIAGKNVLVDHGRFSGLVDLDALAQGDWLEAVGGIRANWYGTDYGQTYTNAVMNALELTEEQRMMVRVYSLYHRYVWMCENGMKFNENTTGVIDQERAKRDEEIVRRLIQECA